MATPRAVPKRSGSSRGKWFFTGALQMHETIPLQILNPFTELFEVGHTSPPTVQMPRSSYGLTSALSPRTSNRGHDDPSSSQLVSRIRPCEAPSGCVMLLTPQ